MNSLRMKLTLALLAMSFVAIAVVGTTARFVTLQRFDRLVIDRAFEGFERELAGYYRTYGSWEEARASEEFLDFVVRTRPQPPVGGPARPPRRLPPGEPAGAGPRPSDRPPPRPFVFGGAPPRFLVVDKEGRVLLPLAEHAVGERIAAEQLAGARPVRLDGREIALAVALERPELTDMEARYVEAIRVAWMYSLLLAGILAIPVGLLLGGRLARPLTEMMGAIRAMQQGELRQSVPVRSKDEVGLLAAAFNRMSRQLAEAYGRLQRSNEEISRQAELLEEQVRRDELTGIANRRAFDEQSRNLFAQAKRYNRPLTLALLDVDRFKEINDRYSHPVGDAVLRKVADLIRSNVRQTDVVARYGGDEFAIAFAETSLEEASSMADRVRRLIRVRNWEEMAPELSVSLSIGLSGDSVPESLEEMLQAADSKLYEAKKQGRDRVCL